MEQKEKITLSNETCIYCKVVATTEDWLGLPSCEKHKHNADDWCLEQGYPYTKGMEYWLAERKQQIAKIKIEF